MDAATVSLIGSVLLFISSIVVNVLSRRESLSRAKNFDVATMEKQVALIDRLQDRNSELSDKLTASERSEEKLRDDLAIALVDNADLKAEKAKLDGYIQGITDPLVKLEDAQRAALRGGRRVTDKP